MSGRKILKMHNDQVISPKIWVAENSPFSTVFKLLRLLLSLSSILGSNCGENVFQCHKCRSINYDEKDPFLCNACGFCKYAKFEYTLTSRPCCAVDPIESEDDRKKAILSINSLLGKFQISLVHYCRKIETSTNFSSF